MQYHLSCSIIQVKGAELNDLGTNPILREKNNMTQALLAKRLNITRSSVNAWEMGISVPSTQYLVDLAELFHVSTDFLLGLNATASLDVSGLKDEDVHIVCELIALLRDKNGATNN